ncbi:MAG: type II toxin-antitoxin system VapC family toxin [Emticicia sp.]|nr:type II toxin-antitoxin system VapC family toxin [Emticicia sp.]
MNLLLDTHTFLWFSSGSDEIPKRIIDLIENANNKSFVSLASLWEISIKTSLGKLQIKNDFDKILNDIEDNKLHLLPISFSHIVTQNKLPLIHRDPFDRLIISQGISENINIISRDEIFDEYLKPTTIKRIW